MAATCRASTRGPAANARATARNIALMERRRSAVRAVRSLSAGARDRRTRRTGRLWLLGLRRIARRSHGWRVREIPLELEELFLVDVPAHEGGREGEQPAQHA